MALAALCFQGIPVLAETPADVLEKDLLQVKQEHDSANSAAVQGIIKQLEDAAGSPDAAFALYQQAGGLTPVVRIPRTQNPNQNQGEPETDAERDARQAKEQEASDEAKARLAATVQAHCQVMMYAVLLVADPNQKGLHDNWITWLKTTGPVYPQLQATGDLRGRRDPAAANGTGTGDSTDSTNSADSTDTGGGGGGGGYNRRRGYGQQQEQGQAVETEPIGDWKAMSVSESIIGKYLGFHAWEGKEQAIWSVASIPNFYKTDVLDPLRATPTADTLAAWDVYIAMKKADLTDADQWSQVDYPTLAFERGSDDYMMKPSMDKLQTLIGIIKGSPTHPKLDDMILRLHTMVEDYKSHHSGDDGGAPSVAPTTDGPAAAGPNVQVQETTDDNGMVVVVTHTNAPPAAPAPPTPAPAPVTTDQDQ